MRGLGLGLAATFASLAMLHLGRGSGSLAWKCLKLEVWGAGLVEV